MKNALIIHGTPSKEEYFDRDHPSPSNHHWIPWLQHELIINNIFTQTPEMPEAYAPKYELWKREFEYFPVTKDSILIGHSCGGGFLVRWLSENNVEVDKVVLVAPWLDSDRSKTTDFFDFEIDRELTKRTKNLHILVSEDDDADILDSVTTLEKVLKEAIIHRYKNLGHFTLGDMGRVEIPEVVNLIKEN